MKGVITIIAIIILTFGVSLFGIGFHNVDYCHNMKFVVYEDLVVEQRVSGNPWTFDECYLTGIKHLLVSVPVMVISALFSGYYIRGLINDNK